MIQKVHRWETSDGKDHKHLSDAIYHEAYCVRSDFFNNIRSAIMKSNNAYEVADIIHSHAFEIKSFFDDVSEVEINRAYKELVGDKG